MGKRNATAITLLKKSYTDIPVLLATHAAKIIPHRNTATMIRISGVIEYSSSDTKDVVRDCEELDVGERVLP